MAKQNTNNIYVVQSVLRDKLTNASKLHRYTQAAYKACRDGEFATMQEMLDAFPALEKALVGQTATINQYNTVE